jgi:hypothetical protein
MQPLTFRQRHPQNRVLHSSRQNAKRAGIEHTIDINDILIPSHCPLLGFELTNLVGNKPTNPSIDRIDPQKGYIKGNIQVISCLANRMKQNATVDQLLTFAKNIIKVYG